MGDVRVILGPPGTGKTTTILDEIEKLLLQGVRPTEIAFVSYTRAACIEARERAAHRFGLDPDEDLPQFRTIHATANKYAHKATVMTDKHWKHFAELCAYQFSETSPEDEDSPLARAILTDADALRQVWDLSRVCCTSIDKAMTHIHFLSPTVTREAVELYGVELEDFKANEGLRDFVDMLTGALASPHRPFTRYAFIDEAQDSNPLQNKLIAHWYLKSIECARVTFVGDDDQSIYGWSGADPEELIAAADRYPTRELEQSYRIPRVVHSLARNIIRQNSRRVAKRYKPRDEQGEIVRTREPEDWLDGEGTTFVLVRNRMFADRMYNAALKGRVLFRTLCGKHAPLQKEATRDAFLALSALVNGHAMRPGHFSALAHLIPQKHGERTLRPRGVLTRAMANETLVTRDRMRVEFGMGDWLDWALSPGISSPAHALLSLEETERAYLGSMLSKLGEPTEASLREGTRLTISTKHRSKGTEADTVVIVPDMARASWRELGHDQGKEDENRVAYVAATRCRKRLVLAAAETPMFYPYDRLAAGVA